MIEQFMKIKDKETLYCPRCTSPLILGQGYRRYQTLVEHVCGDDRISEKEYYICSSERCPTRISDSFWDWYGSSYISNSCDPKIFIMECSSALNSGQRQFDISNKHIDIQLLHLIWFRLILEKYRVPDQMGVNILGYKYKFKGLVKSGAEWCYYTPGIKMFFFCLNKFNNARKKLQENPESTWSEQQMLQELKCPKEDKRWWKMLSAWWLNLLHPGLKEKLQCKKKI
jgi:hypothetical protein